MADNDFQVIVCPVCEQQYLPAEIFFPTDLIGNPKEIIKDTSGKVEFFIGDDQDLDETYICDNCGTKLKIHANLTFKVDAISSNFEEEYVSTYTKPKKLTLEESSLFD